VRGSAARGAPLTLWMFGLNEVSPKSWLLGLLWPFPAGGGSRLFRPLAHLGWAGAVLAGLGLSRAFGRERARWTAPAAALAAACALWACGAFDRALYLLPVFNRFRFNFKLMLYADFFLILLAAW